MYELNVTLVKELHLVRDTLYSEILCLSAPTKVVANNKNKEALNCILSNLTRSHRRGRNSCSIPLKKGVYTFEVVNGYRRKVLVSYAATKRVLTLLEDLEYITIVLGGRKYKYIYQGRGKEGKMVVDERSSSYIKFNQKLIDLLDQVKYNDTSVKQLENVITLRDKDKKDKVFRLPLHLKHKKKELDDYNELAIITTVADNQGRTFDCQLRKIYNINFDTGGRAYMSEIGIQHLSKDERWELTIEGCDTVIYDYVSFEVAIAYSLAQATMDGDPYSKITVAGMSPDLSRELCKKAMTIMINTANQQDAITTMNFKVSEDYDVAAMYKSGEIPQSFIPVRQLIESLEEWHHEIEDYLYQGKESELSNNGSFIMDYILDYFTQRGILVLPVFDEVIIAEHLEEELVQVMGDAWENLLGFRDNMKLRKEK